MKMNETDNPEVKLLYDIKISTGEKIETEKNGTAWSLLAFVTHLCVNVYGVEKVKSKINSILSKYNSTYQGYGRKEVKCECGSSAEEFCAGCKRPMCENYFWEKGCIYGQDYLCEACYEWRLKNNLL